MATVKRMARVVIAKRLGINVNDAVFDAVAALSNDQLLEEYQAVVLERQAIANQLRAQATKLEQDIQ